MTDTELTAPCDDEEHRRLWWRVTQRGATARAYSEILCLGTDCGRRWRIRGGFADVKPNLNVAILPGIDDPIPFDAGWGPRDGYVVGHCQHAVAASEWKAGFRECERCAENRLRAARALATTGEGS